MNLLWQLFFNGLVASGQYALVAVGFGLIYRTTRFFNFAHGAVFTLGAYAAYTLQRVAGLPIAISVVLAIAVAAVAGAMLELYLFRPLKRRGSSNLNLLIAAIAIFTVLQNAISAIFGDEPRALTASSVDHPIAALGINTSVVQVCIVAIAIVLCTLVAVALRFTRFGNAILAVGADATLAECSGINSERVILLVFLAGSALAGVAGVLVALDSEISPLMGYQAMLTAVVAVLVGGARNPVGWVLGAVLLGLAQNVGVWQIGSQWQDTIAFTLLLTFMVFRPRGLASAPEARA